MWRLCVSYQVLNAITSLFHISLYYFEYYILHIGNAKHIITLDMHSGHWQILVLWAYQAKLNFFVMNKKIELRE